ncbi:MAG: hypothetical protein U0271_47050 [Polyangiaceae bacterium]
MRSRAWLAALGFAALSCSGAANSSDSTIRNDTSTSSSTSSSASSAQSSAPAPSATSAPSATVAAEAPSLPADERYRVTPIFDKPVTFFITGEGGRLAALTSEQGVVVPYRFESGAWQRLELAFKQSTDEPLVAGIYFGRDNRPRLMGFVRSSGKNRMVYLRFKDGKWQDQRKELGSLASESSTLYGVLGEADPEVVCKLDSTCLLKSRKGWKEIPASIPVDAVVRAFSGRGYALTRDGLFRADDKGFVRVGGAAPWTTPATGFWVSDNGAAVVVEPEKNRIHELAANANEWKTTESPTKGPRDVVGPETDRWLVGQDGVVRYESGRASRVGPIGWDLSRAIRVDKALFVAGAAGVSRIDG